MQSALAPILLFLVSPFGPMRVSLMIIGSFHHSLVRKPQSLNAIRCILKWPLSQKFPFHVTIITSPKSAVARCLQSIMAETCIRFGQLGARVMIEDKEIPHYGIHADPVKKEVSCWIASEAGKVCEFLFSLLTFLFIRTNLVLFGCIVRTQRKIPNRR